jgi:hypothetical protein
LFYITFSLQSTHPPLKTSIVNVLRISNKISNFTDFRVRVRGWGLEIRGWGLEVRGWGLEVRGWGLEVRGWGVRVTTQ